MCMGIEGKTSRSLLILGLMAKLSPRRQRLEVFLEPPQART